MKTIPARTVLEDILSAYRIRGILPGRDSDRLQELDFGLRGKLYGSYDYSLLLAAMCAHVSADSSIEFEDEFGLHYLIFQPDEGSPDICVFGPFLCAPPSESQFDAFVQKKLILMSQLDHIRIYFSRISVISDILSFKYLLGKTLSHLIERPVFFRVQDPAKTVFSSMPADSPSASSSALAYAAIEARYETEKKILESIQAGNVGDALSYHHILMGFTFESRDADPLRNAKDYVIAANTAFRKAAEYAYVHPLHIDELSGRLTRDIEEVTSEVQLNNLCVSMVRKYCLLVQSYSRKQYSSIIRDCLNYIDFHYMEPLSLTFLAEKYAVNRNYLSSLFHREAGMTLTEYINSTRVRHAIMLLNTTTLSMQDISEQCGFSDANYFTRTFKKLQGTSPLKYRQSLAG